MIKNLKGAFDQACPLFLKVTLNPILVHKMQLTNIKFFGHFFSNLSYVLISTKIKQFG